MSNDTRIADAKVHTDTPTNQAKLDFILNLALDIWWESRSESGAGKSLLNQGLVKLGPDWQPIPGVHTTLEQEIGALPQNWANTRAEIAAAKAAADAATAAVEQLRADLPGIVAAALADKAISLAPVDDHALAVALADELGARIQPKGAPTA